MTMAAPRRRLSPEKMMMVSILLSGATVPRSITALTFQSATCRIRPRRSSITMSRRTVLAAATSDPSNNVNNDNDRSINFEDEADFLRRELAHLESLENILSELEQVDHIAADAIHDGDIVSDAEAATTLHFWEQESLEELLGSLEEDGLAMDEQMVSSLEVMPSLPDRPIDTTVQASAALGLERALSNGVVPVRAGVGCETMPGDFGFDPLGLSDRDLFRPAQQFILNLVPSRKDNRDTTTIAASSTTTPAPPRPKALVLRDYRECELRHGRLAMLAAVVWPLQEKLDALVLPRSLGIAAEGPLLWGRAVTLPYFPLAMTAILLLLGYLDIYSQAVKDVDQIGDAYLPGDCFWDPLQILQGAPDRMTRNMQERELLNGRASMLAVACYVLEESVTQTALVDLERNALLLEPVYQVPFVQRWLDEEFTVVAAATVPTATGSVVETGANRMWEDSATLMVHAVTDMMLLLPNHGGLWEHL